MRRDAIIYTECIRGEDYVKKFEKTFTQDLQICTHYRTDRKWEQIYELLVEHDKQYSTLPSILMEKVDFFLLTTIRFLILESCFELEKYKEGGRLGKLFLKKIDEKRIQQHFEMQKAINITCGKKKPPKTQFTIEQLENMLALKTQCHYLLYKYQMRKNSLLRAQVQLQQTIDLSKILYGFDHNITIKYMKDFQKLIKKIKFEEQLKFEKLQNYQEFQSGMNQLKINHNKNHNNDFLSTLQLKELTLEEQVRSRLPSELKNIQLTPGYLELVGLTNSLAKLDKKAQEPSYNQIRIVSRPGTALKSKPTQQVKQSLGDQLQRQLAFQIHQFDSFSRKDKTIQNFHLLKSLNQVPYDENSDRYPEVRESEIIEIQKPKFENLMVKRPQSTGGLLTKKKKTAPKIVVRDEQGEKVVDQKAEVKEQILTQNSTRKQSQPKLKRPPIFFPKKAKQSSSPTNERNDKSKSSGGRPETIEKSIQVVIADLEPLESHIKKSQQSETLSNTNHHEESLQEYASHMDLPFEKIKESHVEFDKLLEFLEELEIQVKIKAAKKIQRWFRRKKKQVKHKAQSNTVLRSSTRSISQSQSSKIYYESHKFMKVSQKSTFHTDMKNVLHVFDDFGEQKQKFEDVEDIMDNIKAIITLLENINNLKRYFKDITTFYEIGQLGVVKWRFVGVQAGIYQSGKSCNEFKDVKQQIQLYYQKILTQEQQDQLLLQFPQSYNEISKIFHYSCNTKNAILIITIFVEINDKVIQMKLNFKNFEFFALMNKDAILTCPIEILNKLLSLYFEQQRISYQYEENSTYILYVRHLMICCDDIQEEESIVIVKYNQELKVHKTMDQINKLLCAQFLYFKTLNGHKLRRITEQSVHMIENNKIILESRNVYRHEIRKNAWYIPQMTVQVKPKSNKKTLFKPIVMGISEIIDLKKFSENSQKHSIPEEGFNFIQMATTLMPLEKLQDIQEPKSSSEILEEKKQEEQKPTKEELLKRIYAKRKYFTGNYFMGKENSVIKSPLYSQFNPNQHMEPINVQVLRYQAKWVVVSLWFKVNEEFLYQDMTFKHLIDQSKSNINIGFFTIAVDTKLGKKVERKKYLYRQFLDQFHLDRSVLQNLFFMKKLGFVNQIRVKNSIEKNFHEKQKLKPHLNQEQKLEIFTNEQGYESKQLNLNQKISDVKYLQVKDMRIIQLRIREFENYIELMIYQLHSIQYLLINHPDKIDKLKQLARQQKEHKNFGKIHELLLYIKSHNTPIGRLPKFMENYGVESTFNYQINQQSIQQIYLFALKGILSNTFENIKGILFSYFDTFQFTLTKRLKNKIGIVKVDSTLYKLKNLPYYILVCKILPFSARTNIYKLIINHNDILSLKINHLNFHQQIVSLVDMISIFHCNTYNKIQIIIDEKRHLVNRIQLSELEKNILDVKFLKLEIRNNFVVYKKIKRINQDYIIITVKVDIIRNILINTLYIPKFSKLFKCQFTIDDIKQLQNLESLIPQQFWNQKIMFEELDKRTYLQFLQDLHEALTVHYEQLSQSNINKDDSIFDFSQLQYQAGIKKSFQTKLRQRAQTLKGPQLSITQNQIVIPQSQFHSKMQLRFFQFHTSPSFQGLSNVKIATNIKISDYQTNSHEQLAQIIMKSKENPTWLETYFWDKLIDNIQIQRNQHLKNIYQFDSFRGLIRQCIMEQKFNVGDDNYNLDIFFEMKEVEQGSIFNKYSYVNLQESRDILIYFRFQNIFTSETFSFKAPLRQFIYNYESAQNSDNIKMSQVIKIMEKAVMHLQVELEKNQKIPQQIQNNKVSLQYYDQENLTHKKANKRTATNKPYLQLQELDSKYEFVYQCNLIINPTLVLTIFFKEESQAFYFHVEDCINSVNFIKKYKISKVCQSIPYIKELMRLNLPIQLGQRLFKTYKNTLIVEAYNKLSNL